MFIYCDCLRYRLEGEESIRPATPRDISTLRVKSEDGNHTYILKMKFTNTIGDLRQYIQKQRLVQFLIQVIKYISYYDFVLDTTNINNIVNVFFMFFQGRFFHVQLL